MTGHSHQHQLSHYGSVQCHQDVEPIVHSGENDGEMLSKLKKIMIRSLPLICIATMVLYITPINLSSSKIIISKAISSEEDGMMDLLPNEIEHANTKQSIPRENKVLAIEQVALLRNNQSLPPPFSTLDPVTNLNLKPYHRSKWSSPGQVFGERLEKGQSESRTALPTNEWYQNMILLQDGVTLPNDDQRVYTVPYVLKTNGLIAGIKLCSTRILGLDRVVQITYIDAHGLTLGAAEKFSMSQENNFGDIIPKRYTIFDDKNESDNDIKNHSSLTPLGLTVKWNPIPDLDNISYNFEYMSSSIVRGMPYGTVNYKYDTSNGDFGSILPTVLSEIQLYSPPVADSNVELLCSKSKDIADSSNAEQLVHKSVKISFLESDVTWLLFYSHPVYVRCYDMSSDPTATPFVIQATRLANIDEGGKESPIFTSRIALMNNCTIGANPSHCKDRKPRDMSEFGDLLEKHADIYPGQNTKIDYTFFSDDVNDRDSYAYLQYDWDAHHVKRGKLTPENGMADAGLLMYSLPHHREIMYSQSISRNSFEFKNGKSHCTPSLNGNACLVDGAAWVLKETLDEEPSFFAPRPPLAAALHKLSKAIRQDIKFRLPDYFTRGAGDTYFSGKILAKLSRILLVSHEVKELCESPQKHGREYVHACKDIKLPTSQEFNEALDHLRGSTEVWINGTAATPFVYDDKWGGMCSCGCFFNDKTQGCDNTYPDCPAFGDPGLDFGHAFYNDHHFHHGYHIYAAATVAYFDHDWGSKYFENVLLYIRDIANPSALDEYFPTFRMKDWYLGNSWASGIARAFPNGRNQESSSESIAAYEAMSMYGKVMAHIFEKKNDISSQEKASVSRHIKDVGRLLTTTELRSADRYWHVRQSGENTGIYPPEYKPYAVGMLWNMMAQFQTWFGAAPHLAIGIQLLPLTPVSERRDALDWVKQLYPSFAKSCSYTPDCKKQGWGILQHAVLAEVGHPHLAIKYAESLESDAYLSAGGNGHSLTNTIWYYATRPETTPINLVDTLAPTPTPSKSPTSKNDNFIDCGQPETCTEEVLSSLAGAYTCESRIEWLIDSIKVSENDACSTVAGEFSEVCGGCKPKVLPKPESTVCRACTKEECSESRCPAHEAPFLCTSGANSGGCSMVPWELGSNCNQCCHLTYGCREK